mmetsp:Transcript_3131/g.290  ORF Transcript_3131/g.290 Transcript_3131/m.290 type:complete len:97 (-) Transcript_3131:28-318(-)
MIYKLLFVSEKCNAATYPDVPFKLWALSYIAIKSFSINPLYNSSVVLSNVNDSYYNTIYSYTSSLPYYYTPASQSTGFSGSYGYTGLGYPSCIIIL